MPTKKNFLGGQQNYNERTGEYESRLVKADGTGATKANMPGGTDGKGNPQPKADKAKGTAKGISGVAPENKAGAENVNGYQVFEKNGKWHAMDGKGYISPAGGYGSKDEAVNAAKAYNQGADLKGRKAPKEKDEAKYTKTEWGSQFSEDGRSAITSKGHRIEKGMQLPSGDYVTGFDPDTHTIFIDEDPGVEGGRDYDIEDLDDEIARAEKLGKPADGEYDVRKMDEDYYAAYKGNEQIGGFKTEQEANDYAARHKASGGLNTMAKYNASRGKEYNVRSLLAKHNGDKEAVVKDLMEDGIDEQFARSIAHEAEMRYKPVGDYSRANNPVGKTPLNKIQDEKSKGKNSHLTFAPIYGRDIQEDSEKLKKMGIRVHQNRFGETKMTGPASSVKKYYDEFVGNTPQTYEETPLDPENLQKLFDKHGGDEDAVTEELRKKSLDIDDGDLQGVVEAFAMGYNRKRR